MIPKKPKIDGNRAPYTTVPVSGIQFYLIGFFQNNVLQNVLIHLAFSILFGENQAKCKNQGNDKTGLQTNKMYFDINGFKT